MSINATLLGQMITFALFVWFTMAFVWPPLTKALLERRTKIADGLAAAERGQRQLQDAEQKANKTLEQARVHAQEILRDAHTRAGQIEHDAKVKAEEAHQRIIAKADEDIVQLVRQAKEAVRKEVASIAMAGAEKVLSKQVDQSVHQAMLQDLVEEL